jgi:hypothetical protein
VRVIYDSIKRCAVTPYEADAADPSAGHITGYESAQKWGLDPLELSAMINCSP